MARAFLIILLTCLAAFTTGPLYAQGEAGEEPKKAEPVAFQDFDGKMAFDYSQAVIGNTVSDYTFTQPDGSTVPLSDFSGKPVVISLIFTSCLHVCPMITNNLKQTIEGSKSLLGHDDYWVLTIGFDTKNDTPERMGTYAKERGIRTKNWLVLSADEKTMESLTRDLGFIYFPSPSGFDHLAQTTVLTPELKVYRQLYTPNFEAPFLIEPLKELIYGTGPRSFEIANFVEQVRLFCTFFDPKTGRYRFDYSLFIGLIVGTLSLLGIGFFLTREWVRLIRK